MSAITVRLGSQRRIHRSVYWKTGCAGTFCSGIKQLFCGGDHCGRISKIREQKLMRDGFIAWDEAAIRFAMDFNCFCGGRTVKVVWSDDISRDESAEDADILMYCPENGTLHIIETTLGEEQFEELLPELMAQTKTARLVYDREGIMVLSSDDKERQERLLADGYFALSLA